MKTFILAEEAHRLVEEVCRKASKENKELEDKLEKAKFELEETTKALVSMAHSYGMSENSFQVYNALSYINKRLEKYSAFRERAKSLGYSSLENLFKAVSMTSSENRKKKNFSYYEGKLDPALVTIPAELLFVERHNDRTRVKRFLLETLYPTFEMYMKNEKSMEKLVDKWKQVENINSLIDLNNWCIEEIMNGDEPLDEADTEFWNQAIASLIRQTK